MELSKDQCLKFKFIVVGDQSVGKSCLTKRFEFGNFSEEIKSTIGVEFIRKLISIDGKMLEIQLWDTVNIYLSKAGQEQFRSMVRNFYRGSAAVFVVYSVNQRDSFELLSEWIKDIEENSHEEIIKVLVGNKNDLTRVVEIEEAEKFKEQHSFHLFFETSAKTGFNIAEAFEATANLAVLKFATSESFRNATTIKPKTIQIQQLQQPQQQPQQINPQSETCC